MLKSVWEWLAPLHEDLEHLWIFGLFVIVLMALEKFWPADPEPDREGTGSDTVYSLLENLGISGLVLASTLHVFLTQGTETLEALHIPRLNVDAFLKDWGAPAFVSFAVQIFVFDGFDTLRHRVEHRIRWLWAFHSVHHSQTHMTFWTFDRNHVMSLVLNSAFYAGLSWFLGLAPFRFFTFFLVIHFLEYLSHANVKVSFGRWLDRVLVCPLYHRTHHALATRPNKRFRYGCNFANLFPFWDIVLGSANFDYSELRTGIRGQRAEEAGRNWLAHQLSGFRLFRDAVVPRSIQRLRSKNAD